MHTYPAISVFAASLIALFLKTTLTSIVQVASRVRAGTFLVAEDARLMGRKPVVEENPFVQRFAWVWRNDVENLPLFLALALTYTLLGASFVSAAALFGTYVVLRYLHTAVYLIGLQPWRALIYLAGLAVCWTIAFKCIQIVVAGNG